MKRRMLSLVASALLLGGCTEVSDRAYVGAVGVDYTVDGYSVTLQIYSPEGSETDPSKPNVTVVGGKGDTILTALSDAERRQGGRLFLGHLRLILLSKGCDISDCLSYFLLDSRASPSIYAAVADSTAGEILSLPLGEGITASYALSAVLENGEKDGISIAASAGRAFAELKSEYGRTLLPIIGNEGEPLVIGTALCAGDGVTRVLTEEEQSIARLIAELRGECIALGDGAAVFISDVSTEKTSADGGILYKIDISAVAKENPGMVPAKTLSDRLTSLFRLRAASVQTERPPISFEISASVSDGV